MASKMSRTTNFSEQEKLLLVELGKDFPEVESKGYGAIAEYPGPAITCVGVL